MREEEKTVILSLSPEEYENRAGIIASYVLSQYMDNRLISTERKHLRRYRFDSNDNQHYVKLKFEKATF